MYTTKQQKPQQSRVIQRINNKSNVIQRSYFEEIGGTYVWHDEIPNNKLAKTNKKRYYYPGGKLNPLNAIYGEYPVYTQCAIDESGNAISSTLNAEQVTMLYHIVNIISQGNYDPILKYLINIILEVFNYDVLSEFFKGAHIIFNDNNHTIYDEIFRLGAKISKYRNRTFIEWLLRKDIPHNIENLKYSSDIKKDGMGLRRPELKQTSHYEQYILPQLGIDLPAPLNGHILVGIVNETGNKDNGKTFVQTEMYGFTTFYNHYIGHLMGYLRNIVFKQQSGLLGYSVHSEKINRAIRASDNLHLLNE